MGGTPSHRRFELIPSHPLPSVRLAIIVNRFPVISETFIYNKVMALRSAGLDVTVVVHESQNDLPYFQTRLGKLPLDFVRFSPFAKGRKFLPLILIKHCLQSPKQSIALWRRATALYQNKRRAFKAWILALPLSRSYDILHFEYSGLAVEYLDALPLLSPARLLTSCRGAAEQITPLIKPERGEQLKAVFSRMDRIHCVSADMQATAVNYGASFGKTFINHPSIDTSQFQRTTPYLPHPNRPYKLISVGRLHWKKGYDYALMAVRQLLDQGIALTYEIFGAGAEEERLRFDVQAFSLSENVFFRGSQPAESVRDALESADVFLLPSLSEGLSNAVLEAMAMELPVVSTTAGGMGEAIEDGCEGFLVPPRNANLMAEKIKLLMGDGELRQKIGQAGRRRVVEQFNLHQQIERFVSVYNSIMAENS